DLSRRGHERLRSYPHGHNRTVCLYEVRNAVPCAVLGGHIELRIVLWARSAGRGVGMTGNATGSIEARSQAGSRFNITGDRVNFLESSADVCEIAGIHSRYGRSRAVFAGAHSRIGCPQPGFCPAAQATCAESYSQSSETMNKPRLHRSPSHWNLNP